MSFRDRLLALLLEHEDLEKRYESLSVGMQQSTDDAPWAAVVSTTCNGNHGVSRNEDHPVEAYSALSLYTRGSHAFTDADLAVRKDDLPNDASGPAFSIDEESSEDSVAIRGRGSFARSDLLAKRRRKRRLKRIFEVCEACEQEEFTKQLNHHSRKQMSFWTRIKHYTARELEMFVDFWMSFVISANAIFIGIQMDYDKEADVFTAWHAIDYLFTSIFVFELSLKCYIRGPGVYLCGPDRCSNLFDAFLIFVDALQILMTYALPQMQRNLFEDSGVPSVKLFRIIRLIRLTRLVKLLQTEYFKDLLAMVQGMYSGGMTLFWAIIVLGLAVYSVAMVCRSFFGDHENKNIKPYFDTVPRSMYTVFRCIFGDCSTDGGTPLPEHIFTNYGPVFAVGYASGLFVITIGLFNIISAIFVDATMASGAEISHQKELLRLHDEQRWSKNVTIIIRELFRAGGQYDFPLANLSTVLDQVAQVEFSREALEDIVRESPTVVESLIALDIDSNDHRRLSDIFDPDHTGTVTVLDLMNGLQRLRGHPKRSDVVAVDLMVRSLQERVDAMYERITGIHLHTTALHRHHTQETARIPSASKHSL